VLAVRRFSSCAVVSKQRVRVALRKEKSGHGITLEVIGSRHMITAIKPKSSARGCHFAIVLSILPSRFLFLPSHYFRHPTCIFYCLSTTVPSHYGRNY
jgi:hypothetical protein